MSVEKVRHYFEGTEMDGRIIIPDRSSATVALAAQALGTEPDRIAKTMSFLVEDQPVLIVTSGETRVDNRKYKAQFHTKAKMIPGELVEDLTGHAPGGVCPFANPPQVKTYLDLSLKKYETVFPAAGGGSSAIEMTMAQLEKFACGFSGWVDIGK